MMVYADDTDAMERHSWWMYLSAVMVSEDNDYSAGLNMHWANRAARAGIVFA